MIKSSRCAAPIKSPGISLERPGYAYAPAYGPWGAKAFVDVLS
jgi:hypothetical protein